jgi:hypothetical protein
MRTACTQRCVLCAHVLVLYETTIRMFHPNCVQDPVHTAVSYVQLIWSYNI